MTRRVLLPAALLAAIVGVNFAICRELFFVEHTKHVNSIQGLWISMARLAGEHWFRPAWWPYHDGGIPFEHTYAPLVAAATALAARLSGWSHPRAFHFVMGLVCCLGPATLFLLVWRLLRAPGVAFAAALVYSIASPARALIAEEDFNPVRFWSSQRLYTSIVWDDLPHAAAVLFLPLVLLCLWRSLDRPEARCRIGAVLAIAATALASAFGATALVIASACMLAARPRETVRRDAISIAALGAAGYLLASPFLPPSLWAAIRFNQQHFEEDRWSAGSLVALAIVVFGCVLLRRVLNRRKAAPHVRFFVLFGFAASAIPLVDAYLHLHFLPQPNRYHLEMELALAPLIAMAAWRLADRIPRRVRIALAATLLGMALDQTVALRRAMRQNTQPVDISARIESRVARWFEERMPGQRVMVPGSIAQWFNVFTETPQLSGGSFSTSPNWNQQEAMTSILTAMKPEELERAVLWAKAFGVQAITSCGLNSQEFWKGQSSTRFEPLLPVLWAEDDTAIYRVPQRSASLAHVVPAHAPGELRRYVTALDDPGLPLASFRWNGFRGASIEAEVRPGQVISVQTTYHPGWHAMANGRPAATRRDGLGFLLVEPACDGPCRIELTYDGGLEYRVCRALSLLTACGLLGYAGIGLYGGMVKVWRRAK